MSLEEQQFKKWLRRPTIFVANAWFLMAAAGQTIVGYIAAFILQVLALFGAELGADSVSYTVGAVYEIGVLALPLIWYAATHDGVDQSMRLNPPRLSTMLYAALAAFAGVIMVNNLSIWWMLLIEALGGSLYASSIPVPTNVDQLTASILLVGVVPGVCEELFFRGGLMGAWERRGTQQALVITSVLFALLHGSILGLPTQLIMGFVLGYIVLLSDSLYVSMIYHTVHNSMLLILAYLTSGGAEAETLTMAEQVAAAGGFWTLTAQTLLSVAVFCAAMTVFILAQKLHGGKFEKITNGDKAPMTWQEMLVLLAGLVTVGTAYLTDLMTVCGVM